MRARRRRYAAPLAVLALAAAGAAAAPDRTERLAAACNGCHGPAGRGSGAIPALAGQDRGRLTLLLNGWRHAEPAGRDHVMARFARGLDEVDVDALAEHYASTPVATTGPQDSPR
jgi:cytochrome c553